MNVLTGAISIFILAWMDVATYTGALEVTAVVETIYIMLYYFSQLSINLAVFNLIPLPPLDGSKILGTFLPDSLMDWFERNSNYCMILLMVALYLGFLDQPISAAYNVIHDGIWNLAETVFLRRMLGTI